MYEWFVGKENHGAYLEVGKLYNLKEYMSSNIWALRLPSTNNDREKIEIRTK